MAKKRGADIIHSAMQQGFQEIQRRHPDINENYLAHHIDQSKVDSYLSDLFEKIHHYETKGEKWSNEKKAKFLQINIARHIASGGIFDEKGKEFLLKRGLLEKKVDEKRDSLDEIFGAFKDLYALMKSGEYAHNMPELANAVKKVYDLGFISPAVDILRQYNLLDDRGYDALKRNVQEGAQEAAQYAATSLYARSLPEYKKKKQKIAASILAVAGIFIIFASGMSVTGNVIGNSSTSSGSLNLLAGLLLGISSLILFNNNHKKARRRRQKRKY